MASGPLRSHIDPTAAAARVLRRGGQAVSLVAPASMAEYAARAYGLAITPAGIDWTRGGAIGHDLAAAFDHDGNDAFLLALQDIAADGVLPMRTDLCRIATDWRPDVILRDSSDIGSLLAARSLGIPSVALDVGVSEHTPGGVGRLVRALRERYDATDALEPLVTPAPRGLLLDAPEVRPFQHEDPVRQGEALPAWVTDMDPTRPLIYVSLGSLLPRAPGLARVIAACLVRIAQGLRDLPVNVIMSTGPAMYQHVSAAVGDLPHIRLLPHAPQTLILRTVDLFITHGGFGSIREAIASGVPMIAVGITTDQPENARRLADLGIAVSLPLSAPCAEFAAMAQLILTDPARRAPVRAWQRRMLAELPLTAVLPAALDEVMRT